MARTSIELVPPGPTDYEPSLSKSSFTNLELQLRAIPEAPDTSTTNLADDGAILQGHEFITEVSRLKGSIIIATASGMMAMNSMLSGVLTVGLPTIAREVNLEESLLLWPASVYGLTCGCTLLLSGSMGDIIGCRTLYLVGCALLSAFTLGCGLAQTGIQLIIFRAISGVAMSLCLPSQVSIITTTFPTGKRRNIAFACLGAAQPVGFSLGLVVGGLLVDTVGWRYGYYIVAAVNVLILGIAFWGVPKDPRQVDPVTWKRIYTEIDWIGTVLISGSLGMFSYILATMTSSIRDVAKPSNIVVLVLAGCGLAAFVAWVVRQEKLGRVALIPPSLFRSNPAAPRRARNFTCICVSVFFTWAVFNAFQYFTTLYFQRLQGLTTLQSSARFVPMVISGCLANVATGLLVNKVSANILCVVAAFASTIAPLLMAIASPNWIYWTSAFFGTLLIPISADTLFTVSNLVITSVFPPKTHGLAGGVFNTISQIGMSVGLALTAVVASAVGGLGTETEMSEAQRLEALLKGYRATYWMSFAASAVIVVFSWWGLRSIGKIGLKRD
ncbi:hypothetical protein AJ80_04048 [Polytolypa hystricis UAMH7299]|uniref:Major facilitator superfamily (MFS) profile domain-containing protein n=1 Tax=Polytolypa hystricis (strain UAMH7299) TaxID=1447883 RepID=A0A2B7YDE8_POLH7|nr:hypothetical protein AJ80_04048 [Polytolypa hystricis UAMH7299]